MSAMLLEWTKAGPKEQWGPTCKPRQPLLSPVCQPASRSGLLSSLKCVPQVHDGAPATLAELAEVEEDLTAGAMQVRICSIGLRMRCPRLGGRAVL